MQSIPNHWEIIKLKCIANVLNGFGFPKKFQGKKSGDYPFIKVQDISDTVKIGKIYIDTANNYIDDEICSEHIKGKPLPKNSIIFAKIGEAIRKNRKVILNQPSLVDNNVAGVSITSNKVNDKFIFFFLKNFNFEIFIRATTVPSFRKSDIENIEVPLPPLEEQLRIVAKIEELFSRLDAGRAALKRARANLARYRQSLLQAAFSGALTRVWREEHKDELEPAGDLLKRIRFERRARWIANLRAKGKDLAKAKYSEPELPDTAGLPDLPNGWGWCNLGEIVIQIKESINPTNIKETKYIGLANIDKETGKLLSFGFSTDVRSTKSRFKTGDILYGKLRPYLSKVLVADFDGVCSTDILVLKNKIGVDTKFIKNLMLENSFVSFATESMSGVQHPRTNFNKISNYIVALPPTIEQIEISESIDLNLSIIENLERSLEEVIKKDKILRKSILEKAFSGQLVPPTLEREENNIIKEKVDKEV